MTNKGDSEKVAIMDREKKKKKKERELWSFDTKLETEMNYGKAYYGYQLSIHCIYRWYTTI